MITLKTFLSADHVHPRNLYVKFKGFTDLYVRKGPYLIGTENSREYKESIQIANVTARKEGRGAFRGLIDFLEKNYPERVIVVECVQTERLEAICRHMGFEQINVGIGLHFAKGDFS
jgi:hypothetical protein